MTPTFWLSTRLLDKSAKRSLDPDHVVEHSSRWRETDGTLDRRHRDENLTAHRNRQTRVRTDPIPIARVIYTEGRRRRAGPGIRNR